MKLKAFATTLLLALSVRALHGAKETQAGSCLHKVRRLFFLSRSHKSAMQTASWWK
jgi:hypothetical protein